MKPHADIARALELLRSEGVVVLPTDTLYGFHAALSSEAGAHRIRALKGGDPARRLVVLAANIEMVSRFVASFGCSSREELEGRWPSKLTVVVPTGGDCPPWVGDTVAVRVPDLLFLREIIDALGEPIVSTSVNRAGEPPQNDPVKISQQFDVDLVVAGEMSGAGASTIVDLCGDEPRVLRAGDYAWVAGTGDSKPSK